MAKFLFILFIVSIRSGSYAQTGTVILNVQGIQVSKGGEISSGIFKKENFPKVGKQSIGKEVEVSSPQMQIKFENVPIGTYGMVAFQDIDKDKLLKSNFMGFPKEPIGFSRNAKIKFGPPDFEDAKVEIQQGKTLTLTIILK